MEQVELNKRLQQHKEWLLDNIKGKKADFHDMNLSNMNFKGANLRNANFDDTNLSNTNFIDANLTGATFRNANLRNANLTGTNLVDTYFRNANFKYANLTRVVFRNANLINANLSNVNFIEVIFDYVNLRNANLSSTNLSNANLSNANFSYAIFNYANLSGANLFNANFSYVNFMYANLIYTTNLTNIQCINTNLSLQCPEEGAFIGFKKCRDDVIIKIQIMEDALRSSATTRKCRASKIKVLEIFGAEEAISVHDENFIYHVGDIKEITNFDKDRWKDCSAGIHFFITKKEAENYQII